MDTCLALPTVVGHGPLGAMSFVPSFMMNSAAAQLNSVTLSVPAVLSLLSAEICEPAGTWITSTQIERKQSAVRRCSRGFADCVSDTNGARALPAGL